jgi:hypothetical protein
MTGGSYLPVIWLTTRSAALFNGSFVVPCASVLRPRAGPNHHHFIRLRQRSPLPLMWRIIGDLTPRFRTLDRGFIELVQHCGLFWIFDGICIAAERPSHINRDEAGQLHCEVGPSIALRSGWSWWHWHGTEVWQALIEEPQRISVEAIERMPSPDLRRIMIERYRAGEETQGIAAYLRDSGGIRLDQDEAFGTLWRRAVPGEEPFLAVEVVNHTAEPDGSYRHHFLRVDPELRPILSDGQLGAPQRLTARNAVASGFGLRGPDYQPDVES